MPLDSELLQRLQQILSLDNLTPNPVRQPPGGGRVPAPPAQQGGQALQPVPAPPAQRPVPPPPAQPGMTLSRSPTSTAAPTTRATTSARSART